MKQRTITLILVFLLLTGVLTAAWIFRIRAQKSNQQIAVVTPTPTIAPTIQESVTPSPVVVASPTPQPVQTPTLSSEVKKQVLLDVPFTSQAPFGNWDSVHEETCEEAALLMAAWYAENKSGEKAGGYSNRIPPQTAEDSLMEIVDWEKQILGHFEDTTAEESLRIAKEKLNLNQVSMTTDVTAQKIKQALSNGQVIVLPTAGRLLNNPYFTAPGPPYHMIVVRGYSSKGFVTHDPGTRHGESYVYSEKVLMNAIHDWTGSADTIEQGRKVMILVGKNT